MKTILCLFDYGPNCMTGYATVTRNIVKHLKHHFGYKLMLDICAVNYYEGLAEEYDGTVRIMSGKLNQEKNLVPDFFKQGDDFGRLQFLELLRYTDYDGIFIVQDLGVTAPMIANLMQIYAIKVAEKRKPFKSMIYFPVDGLIHSKVKRKGFDKKKLQQLPKEHRHLFTEYVEQVKELKFFDKIVTYTHYGKTELLKHEPGLKDHIDIIYHGINTNDFYPITNQEEKTKFRKEYFQKNANKIIVGLINRNQPRKDIPTAIFGFMEAVASYKAPEGKEYFLYLHMNPDDPLGWSLRDVLSQTNLREGIDYMFPKGGDHNSQVPVDELNRIYNSIDMYVSTASGGGWELSVTEAMACKIPVIIPKHTSMKEIGADGRAFFIEEFLPVSIIQDNVKRYMCHYDEVAEKICNVTNMFVYPRGIDPSAPIKKMREELLQKIIDNAYQWVTQLTWENICKQWIDNFEQVFKIK